MPEENKSEKKHKFLNKKVILNAAVLLLVFGAGLLVGVNDGSLVQWAKYGKSSQNNGLPQQLNYSGVEEVYSQLKDSFDGELDPNKLEDGLKEGLVRAAGDPFTEFLNAESTKEFEEGLSGSFEGIGAELGKEEQTIVIISPISGFPAEKAGLKAGDIISEIDGESAYDITVTEAVKKIRGEKGTKVKLKIIRDGKPLDFEITRDTISIPSVKSKMVKGNVGLIEISRFGDDTTDLARKAAIDLKNQGAKGIVLDLRGNPGGLLDSAVDVSSLWLPQGTLVVDEKRGETVVKTHKASGDAVLQGIPTVVLINGGSASASEIVAGALKDNDAAVIVGEKSYGKGSVQEVIMLEDDGSLKVTIARWFTPSGRNIDKEGIEPDQKVELSEKDVKAKKDPQLDAAIKKLQTQ